MPNISELFAELAEKAGIDITSEELKPLMSLTVEVPDAISKKINTSLISLDSAVKNHIIRNQVIKEYGAGLLQNNEEVLRDLGVSDDIIAEISKEKSFGKKIEASLRKIAEIKSKPDANSTADQKTLNEQIVKLNKELSEIKNTHILKTDHEVELLKFESERLESLKEEAFGKHKWSEAFSDSDIRKAAYNAKLNSFLDSKGLALKKEGKDIKIILKEGGTEYFDDKNNIVTFDHVVNQIMSDNKFIAVSQTAPGTSTTVLPGNQGQIKVEGNNPRLTKTKALIAKSLADQEANQD